VRVELARGPRGQALEGVGNGRADDELLRGPRRLAATGLPGLGGLLTLPAEPVCKPPALPHFALVCRLLRLPGIPRRSVPPAGPPSAKSTSAGRLCRPRQSATSLPIAKIPPHAARPRRRGRRVSEVQRAGKQRPREQQDHLAGNQERKGRRREGQAVLYRREEETQGEARQDRGCAVCRGGVAGEAGERRWVEERELGEGRHEQGVRGHCV